MAEVAKSIYQKIVEAGLPVKIEEVVYAINEKRLKTQGPKVIDRYDENFVIEFTNLNDIKDQMPVPTEISKVWMSIGKRAVEINLKDADDKELMQISTNLEDEYDPKFKEIMKENGFIEI